MHRLLAWLAVFTLLVQLVVPDLAMAARDAAAMGPDPAVVTHHEHRDHRADHQPRPQPAHHDHGAFCPFCIAQAAHALPLPDTGIPVPSVATLGAQPPADTTVTPERHFLSCLHCRAPPRDLRT